MSEKLSDLIVVVLIGLTCGFVIYFSWKIGRYVNYNISYKDMVIQTIKENVKSELLK